MQVMWLMYCKSAICNSGQFEFDYVINWKTYLSPYRSEN